MRRLGNWKGDETLTEASSPSNFSRKMHRVDAKLTSTILHIIMKEVFRWAGAEVAPNEVVAEMAAREISEVFTFIYICKE